MNQNQITQPGPLLDPHGQLREIGWARQPLLDCNLEQSAFYPPWKRFLQPLRVKRWDYYAFFTPRRFFSATIADLGYAANVFVYVLDFATDELHEEGKILLRSSVQLPRNSDEGVSAYRGKDLQMEFQVQGPTRRVKVDWPAFNNGRGIHADLCLASPPEHESMAIVIPIAGSRFYYNRKINCLPAEGLIQYGPEREVVDPQTSVGSLDWGRGVWEYSSYWNWASTSGFLPDGRTIGFNLGTGFGDTSLATENALILDGKIHKLGFIPFDYTPGEYMKPWHFRDDEGRLDLTFTPFKERVARSNLLVIVSEVHQMFGRYSGKVVADDGEQIQVDGLIGFAEEHHAKW